MEGADKAMATLAGVPLILNAIRRLAPQCASLAISANGPPDRFEAFGLPVLPDGIGGFVGPLAGILAGLDWVSRELPQAAHLATIPVDTPFVPPDFVRRLHEAAAQGTGLVCAGSGGRRHPAAALWPVAMREDIRQALGRRERRLSELLDRLGCDTVDWPAEPADPFFNVNTPQDLEAAAAMAAAMRG